MGFSWLLVCTQRVGVELNLNRVVCISHDVCVCVCINLEAWLSMYAHARGGQRASSGVSSITLCLIFGDGYLTEPGVNSVG